MLFKCLVIKDVHICQKRGLATVSQMSAVKEIRLRSGLCSVSKLKIAWSQKKKKNYSARLCVCIYIHTLIINKFLNIFFFKITNNRINITLSDRIFLPKGVHESGLVLLVFFDFWIICLLIVKLWYFFKIICIYITRTSLWYSILMTPSISKWFDIYKHPTRKPFYFNKHIF